MPTLGLILFSMGHVKHVERLISYLNDVSEECLISAEDENSTSEIEISIHKVSLPIATPTDKAHTLVLTFDSSSD